MQTHTTSMSSPSRAAPPAGAPITTSIGTPLLSGVVLGVDVDLGGGGKEGGGEVGGGGEGEHRRVHPKVAYIY